MKMHILKSSEESIKRTILYGIASSVVIVSTLIGVFLIFAEYNNFKEHMAHLKIDFIEKERQKLLSNMNILIKDLSLKQNFIFQDKKYNLKKELLQRYTLVENIYNDYHKIYTKNEIIKIVKKRLKDLATLERFKNYFLLYNDGKIILNTSNSSIENRNIMNIRDVYGVPFIERIISKSMQNKQGTYFSYKWIKPNSFEVMSKLNFIRYFKPLNLVIGAGFFKDSLIFDVENAFSVKVINDKHTNKAFSSYYSINFFHIPFDKEKFALLKASNSTQPLPNNIELLKTALKKLDYSKGKTFIKIDNFLYYASYLDKTRYLILLGVNLDIVKKPLDKEIIKAKVSLYNNLFILITILFAIGILLFIFSYLFANKIQAIFINYKEEIFKTMKKTVSIIAHQWKQPLSVISASIGNLQVGMELNYSKEDIKPKIKKEINEKLSKTSNYIEDLAKIINNFTNYRSDNAFIVCNDLKKFITDKLSNHKEEATKNGIIIDIDIGENIRVNLKQNAFFKVLAALVENAIEALSSQDIDKPTIVIKVIQREKDIITTVSDNGSPISTDIMYLIFDPYFSTKPERHGKGLGLYFAKTITEQNLYGKMKAFTTKKGNTFTFTASISKG